MFNWTITAAFFSLRQRSQYVTSRHTCCDKFVHCTTISNFACAYRYNFVFIYSCFRWKKVMDQRWPSGLQHVLQDFSLHSTSYRILLLCNVKKRVKKWVHGEKFRAHISVEFKPCNQRMHLLNKFFSKCRLTSKN